MTTVLVTGGAGYLGSTLVPALLERGCAVTVVDNFMFGQDSLSAVCHHAQFSLVRGDVRDRALMRPLITAADVIIPLAALVGAPLCDRDPLAATSTNKQAIVDMLADLGRDQRVLLPITNSGYGVGETGKFCTEDTPLRPVSL
jgi:nucleoside-diphosphate-sugar epimerase